jgi:hypothetical protein
MMHQSQIPSSQPSGGYGPGPNSKPMPVSAGKVKLKIILNQPFIANDTSYFDEYIPYFLAHNSCFCLSLK